MNEDVDHVWYLAAYSDVAQAGLDPEKHYLLYGKNEGRFPNGMRAKHAVISEEVDSHWYLKKYTDVAEADANALEHFLRYGKSEGRSPNHISARLFEQLENFDPSWYVCRYHDVDPQSVKATNHYRDIGFYEGRSPNAASEPLAEWEQIFDRDWYTDRYADVRKSGIAPLQHFVRFGLGNGRRPNPSYKLPANDVHSAAITCLKYRETSSETALLVTHSRNGVIKPHVLFLINALTENEIACILIIATEQFAIDIPDELFARCSSIYLRSNDGFDFAAWAHLFHSRPELFDCKRIFLLNDSVIGPISRSLFAEVLHRIRTSKSDLIGLTDNSELGWHIQSFFLVISEIALRSSGFRFFVEDIKSLRTKNAVINEYETQMAAKMLRLGLRCEVLFEALTDENSTTIGWKSIIERGFPFLKVSVCRDIDPNICSTGWRDILSRHDYDLSIVDRTLECFSREAITVC